MDEELRRALRRVEPPEGFAARVLQSASSSGRTRPGSPKPAIVPKAFWQATAKDIVSKLKAIHVRTFEFDKEGMYSEADLDTVRSLLKSPPWSRVIDAKERREHTQIFVRQDKGDKGEIVGIVIISAEARELSIVSIDGAIDLSQLGRLGGNFGIPDNLPKTGGATAKDSAE